MFFYKDSEDNTYRLDSKDFESTLPAGCAEITEAEVDAIKATRSVVAPATKEQRIAALLSVRGLNLDSEWQLYAAIAGMQAAGAVSGKTEAQLYASNPGYKNAKDLFLAVAAIRAEA